MSCNRCGGWIELGINDVHGYCNRCGQWVGNDDRMDLCKTDNCPMCEE